MLGCIKQSSIIPSAHTLRSHTCSRGNIYYTVGATIVCWAPLTNEYTYLEGHARPVQFLQSSRYGLVSADTSMILLWDGQTNLKVSSIYIEDLTSLSVSASDLILATTPTILYTFKIRYGKEIVQHDALRLNNVKGVLSGVPAGSAAVYAAQTGFHQDPVSYVCLFKTPVPDNNYAITWIADDNPDDTPLFIHFEEHLADKNLSLNPGSLATKFASGNLLINSPSGLGNSNISTSSRTMTVYKQQVNVSVPLAQRVFTLKTGLLLLVFGNKLEIRNASNKTLASKDILNNGLITSACFDYSSGYIGIGCQSGTIFVLEDTSLKISLQLNAQRAFAARLNLTAINEAIMSLSLYSGASTLAVFAVRADGLAYYADLATGSIRRFILSFSGRLLAGRNMGKIFILVNEAGIIVDISASRALRTKNEADELPSFAFLPGMSIANITAKHATTHCFATFYMADVDSYVQNYLLLLTTSGHAALYNRTKIHDKDTTPLAVAELGGTPLACTFVYNGAPLDNPSMAGQLYIILTFSSGTLLILSVPDLHVLVCTQNKSISWSGVAVAAATTEKEAFGDYVLLSAIGKKEVLICRATIVSTRASSYDDGMSDAGLPDVNEEDRRRGTNLHPLMIYKMPCLNGFLIANIVVHPSSLYCVALCSNGLLLYRLPEFSFVGRAVGSSSIEPLISSLSSSHSDAVYSSSIRDPSSLTGISNRTNSSAAFTVFKHSGIASDDSSPSVKYLMVMDCFGLYICICTPSNVHSTLGGSLQTWSLYLLEFVSGIVVDTLDNLPEPTDIVFSDYATLTYTAHDGCLLNFSITDGVFRNMESFNEHLKESAQTVSEVWIGCTPVEWDGVEKGYDDAVNTASRTTAQPPFHINLAEPEGRAPLAPSQYIANYDDAPDHDMQAYQTPYPGNDQRDAADLALSRPQVDIGEMPMMHEEETINPVEKRGDNSAGEVGQPTARVSFD